MKRLISLLVLIGVLLLPGSGWATDKKISARTLKSVPVAADTTAIVDSADGTDKKVTLGTIPAANALITGKPEITVGDTGYATFAAAVAAIGSTNVNLVIGSNVVPPNTIPANINLKFVKGGMLDTTGFPSAHPTAMAASSSVTLITKVGHGLVNGDKVVFTGITQAHATPDGSGNYAADWMAFNNYPITVTRINDDTFTVPFTSTGFTAYNAGVDAGKYSKICNILGTVEAGLYQIFNCNSPAICLANLSTGTKAQFTIYPDWFGAKGDETTDDLAAFNYMTAAAVMSTGGNYGKQEIVLPHRYLLSDTWSFCNIGNYYTGLTVRGLNRRYSGIISQASGYPAIERLATQNIQFENFSVVGNCEYNVTPPSTGVPSVAILDSRSNISAAEGNNNCKGMDFYGYFQYGIGYNLNQESCRYENLRGLTRIPDSSVNHLGFVFGVVSVPTDFSGVVPRNGVYGSRTGENADSCLGSVFRDVNIDAAMKVNGSAFYAEGTHGVSLDVKDSYIGLGVTSGVDSFRIHNGGYVNIDNSGGEASNTRYYIYFYADSPGSVISGPRIIGGHADNTAWLATDANTAITNGFFDQCGAILALGSITNTNIHFQDGSGRVCYLSVAGSFAGSTYTGSPSYVNLPGNDSYTDNANISLYQDNTTGNNTLTRLTGRNVSFGNYHEDQGSPVWFNNGKYMMLFRGVGVNSPDTYAARSWPIGSICWNTSTSGPTGYQCNGPGGIGGTFGTLVGVTGTSVNGSKTLTVNSLSDIHVYDFLSMAGAFTGAQVLAVDYTHSTATMSTTASGTVSSPTAVSYYGPPTFVQIQTHGSDPALITYSNSMTPNAMAGTFQWIQVSDGTGFTMNAPINGQAGQELTLSFRNTSGGACGTITWDGNYKMPAFTGPAAGSSKTITFKFISFWGFWLQTAVTADFPN